MTPSLPASGHGEVAGLVEELRAGLEGVTPGPWRASRFGFQIVSDHPEPAWQSVVELQTKAKSEPNAELEMRTQQAIAQHLARCSPDNIAKLLDHIEALTAQLDGARKLADGYGIVLTMISAGCSDPKQFATRMLAEYDHEARALGIVK